MSQKCQSCKGAATNAFLCGKCAKTLREDLAELPYWLNRLYEAVVGQVRLGDGGSRQVRTMHGDDDLGSHIEALPSCECDPNWPPPRMVEHGFVGPLLDGWRRLPAGSGPKCDCDPQIARQKRERSALKHALALGRVNANASELHDDARNVLSTWIRHLCESRGIQLVDPRFIGPLRPGEMRGPGNTAVGYAKWLHANVSTIANDEAAGECVDELADIRKRIERTVNRPQPRVTLGRCPTWIEEAQKACGKALSAPADAITIRCRDCGQTHRVARLQLLLVGDQEREKVTMARVRELNRNLPPEYRIPESTMRQWIAKEQLKPRGHTDDGEPLYLWRDVRTLRAERPARKRG